MVKTGVQVTFIERLGPNCAVGADDYQWVVLKAAGEAKPGRADCWQGKCWRAVGYIHSSKAALLDCLRVKGLEPDAAGAAALARQPRRIYRWVKD